MTWLVLVSYFFDGAFLANAIPHFVNGVMGRPFQSLFAKPPGQGLSSSTVNVLWGSLNMVVSYALICRVGHFDLRNMGEVAAMLLGICVTALLCARQFGRLHGGNNALVNP